MDDSVDTKKLRMFVTTVKTGSMAAASKQLFVTPSALSHGIRALEESLNTKLFERHGPKLRPTSAGLQFFREALDILSRLDSVIALFTDESNQAQKQVHVGMTNTACTHLFPSIVREFRESFPDVTLKLEIGDTDDLVRRVTDGSIDIVIAPIQREYRELTQTELGHDELVYIVHPNHPWAIREKVDRKTLADQRLIMPSVQSHTYNLIDAFYRQMRIPLEPFIELNNEDAIKQLVSLNIGTGIVPRWIAEEEIDAGILLAFPFSNRSLLRRWTISYRASATLSFPEFLFVGTTRGVARNLIKTEHRPNESSSKPVSRPAT